MTGMAWARARGETRPSERTIGTQWHTTTRHSRAVTQPARTRDTVGLRAAESGSTPVSWSASIVSRYKFFIAKGEAAFVSRHGSKARDTALRTAQQRARVSHTTLRHGQARCDTALCARPGLSTSAVCAKPGLGCAHCTLDSVLT